MIPYPEINPIALQLGPLKIHWYGIMYVIGFLGAWCLGTYRAKKPGSPFTTDQVADILFYGALGVIIGGRLGYMLFYDFPDFVHNPLIFFRVWDGGMSFHGGLLGVIIALWLFAWHLNKSLFTVTDFVAPLVPIGLAAGRVGNFINGELWGRVTDVPWAMIFPRAPTLQPRHPSQIYEFLLEGVLLFLILWFYSKKPKPLMAVSGMFLLCYGCFRIFAEFFRQPDIQLGYIFAGVTMGQILSLPMVLAGVIMLVYAYRKQNPEVRSQNSEQ